VQIHLPERSTSLGGNKGDFPLDRLTRMHAAHWQWIDNYCQQRHNGLEKVEPVMETMNIALPESMKHFVQERVTEGGYSSVSEYMRELIRADQKRKVEERIDTLLLEGLDSGQPIPVTPEFWEEKKRRLTERLSKAFGRNDAA
jgi:antitoxin ParD1/3/4